MKAKEYLAVDIGASSGRVISARVEENRISLEEIHRFPNGQEWKNGHLCWDTEALFGEILKGLKKCGGREIVSLGVDAWGVDFVLLDENLAPLGPAVGYRDSRTKHMEQEVYRLISREELYARTGIQEQPFNTIFQLMAVKRQQPELLEKARALLFLPDYFHFLLTGRLSCEYTIASTSGLLHAKTKDWDWELLDLLGYPREIFQPLRQPGEELGEFTPEIGELLGFSARVVLPPSHDTASAVAAVPCAGRKHPLYLSSGTWSLLGMERTGADCSPKSNGAGLSNEGGCGGRIRHLKNIMGLWMIQSVRRELPGPPDFAALSQLARENEGFPGQVDVNDGCFLAPDSMLEAVQDYCRRENAPVPETPGQVLAVIYRSLAACYRRAVEDFEEITGHHFQALNIVGGGSRDEYLNRLTAKALNRPVIAGPTEATSLGNVLLQMMANGEFETLEEGRSLVEKSFPLKQYKPEF